MILRKAPHLLHGILVGSVIIASLSLAVRAQEGDSKSYDENDWIPIAPKHAPQPVVENVEKKATGRVLNLAEPPANSFFPEEVKPTRNNNFQQYLRETTTFQKVPQRVQPQEPSVRVKQPQHPYKFESSRPQRPAKPQKEFYVPQQQPQQAQFVQYYQPQQYHTIPEEYLTEQLPQPIAQAQYFPQNFEIPDLPPIRLNATPSRFEKRPKPVAQREKVEEKENVQLLYVPLEQLQQQQIPAQQSPKRPQDLPRLHAYQQAPIADLPSQFVNYRPIPPAKQQQIQNIQSDFAQQALEAHKLQLQLQHQPQPEEQYNVQSVEVSATEPSTTKRTPTKKRKAHQPPLAVYMGGASNADVNDVLALLKNAKSIEVQDSVGPNSPKIFVGPSTLEAPKGYTKFELPYLSSLDTNRVERKVDQYPFFVAPLSYKAPNGYSKIPLPSPHVGSVVVSTKEKEPKPQVQNLPDTYQEFTLQNIPQFEYQQRPSSVSPAPSSPSSPAPIRYSKPIPQEHVINQHEIDQINSFIPQYNENIQRGPESLSHGQRFQEVPARGREPQQRDPEPVQRVPEKYNIETYQRPQTSPARPSTIRFATTAQPQLSEQEFIDEILHQQNKPSTQVRHEEYIRPASIPTQNEGQYLQEVTRPSRPSTSHEQYSQEEDDEDDRREPPQPTRTTHVHSTTRSRTTPAPQEYEDITKAPTRVRTRPTQAQTHVRESYEIPSRTTHLRNRPATATPAPSTPEPVDQYLKETVIEPRPRPRPTSTSAPVTERAKYSVQEQFSIRGSTTPSPLQYTAIAEEYEEEIKPHRPVIFKYKQSEDVEYQRPAYHSTTPKSVLHQHQLNQEELDAKILSQDTSGNFVSGPGHQIYQYSQEDYEEPIQQVKTQNANVENYNIAAQGQHGQLHNIINNLEDQSVRQLLQPGLIPTSPKPNDVERYEVSSPPHTTPQPLTSNYPSTHLPVVEPTTKKVTTRGRVRGNRFSTTTPVSISSTRRTSPTRGRRPLPGRSRYQDDNEHTTEGNYARSTTDPTKRIVTARSRFRTRGRPVVDTTDRASSAYEQVDVTPSHVQSSHVPSVQVIEPQVTQRVNQEYINYRPIYNVPVEQSETVLINPKKVTKPATEPVVIHQINQLPIKNLEEENTENTSSRSRLRGRRPSTTATPQVSTSRKYETQGEDQTEDFYGFFREPTFRKPVTEQPIQETPRPVYSSTYVSSTLRPTVQEDEIQPQVRYLSSTENVQFVGEIRPKYQTTAQYYDVSQPSISTERYIQTTAKEIEEEKPRVRQRVRVPTRTRVTDTRSKANEDSKSVTQRSRTRGKTHYRVPQKPKKQHDSSEDEDVEGGNYPAQFKAFQTTPRPSFQITVDPQEDQEGFASIYRPTYVAKENNNKEVNEKGSANWVENYQVPNFIPSDTPSERDIPVALPSIATAPEVNQAIQEGQDKAKRTEESVEKIVEEMLQEYEDNSDNDVQTTTPMTTISVPDEEDVQVTVTTTTTVPETTTQKRRRGVWKLVRRPVEGLEGAESQNPASNQNLLETHDKPLTIEIHAEPDLTSISAVPELETTTQTSTSTNTESGFFDSLYDMFNLSQDKSKLQETEAVSESESTTTQQNLPIDTTLTPDLLDIETSQPEVVTTTTTTTMRPAIQVESTTPLTSMTYITPMSLETWNKGILKTSTSTEISHETEICYKGKCIKSKDMKVPMT